MEARKIVRPRSLRLRTMGAFGCVCAIAVSGCSTVGGSKSTTPAPSSRPATSSYNLSGYSEGFKQGYADACASPRRRNGERYKSDTDYSMGWNDGQSVCRGR